MTMDTLWDGHLKEKYKLNNAKESHLNLNRSSYIFPSLPNTNN